MPGDRIAVKHTPHKVGTVKRLPEKAPGYVEYLCDCHKQFRFAKLEQVTKLGRK